MKGKQKPQNEHNAQLKFMKTVFAVAKWENPFPPPPREVDYGEDLFAASLCSQCPLKCHPLMVARRCVWGIMPKQKNMLLKAY